MTTIYEMKDEYFAMLKTAQILTNRIEHIAFSVLDDCENLETETLQLTNEHLQQVKYLHELLKMLQTFETEMQYYFDMLITEAVCLRRDIDKINYGEN